MLSPRQIKIIQAGFSTASIEHLAKSARAPLTDVAALVERLHAKDNSAFKIVLNSKTTFENMCIRQRRFYDRLPDWLLRWCTQPLGMRVEAWMNAR